ncbi:hypothetical protein RJ55_06931 [Drechmeria coniospora]|nr:hypothetical protein RJ55_06931 [Drechmeria coniospora]
MLPSIRRGKFRPRSLVLDHRLSISWSNANTKREGGAASLRNPGLDNLELLLMHTKSRHLSKFLVRIPAITTLPIPWWAGYGLRWRIKAGVLAEEIEHAGSQKFLDRDD